VNCFVLCTQCHLTVLICSTSEGSLSIVDTHAVSSDLNGDCRNDVIVHCLNTVTALAGITNWLFVRMFGTAAVVEHELAISCGSSLHS